MTFWKTYCRPDLTFQYCDLGNIFSVFWQIIGFTAILPQIHLVWQTQTVEAVHVLWPTILVTAALSNAFYVFAVDDRVFFRLASVYYPIIYVIFLIEIWLLTKKNAQKKLLYAAVCIIMWASLLTIELTVSFSDGAKKLNWVSIVLYSIKIMPQLILNIRLRTTFGQSSICVLLYCIESSFAFMTVYLLEYELKYRVMHYMSSSLYYINGIQVIWYPKPTAKVKKIHYGTLSESQDYSAPFEERHRINSHPMNATYLDEHLELEQQQQQQQFESQQHHQKQQQQPQQQQQLQQQQQQQQQQHQQQHQQLQPQHQQQQQPSIVKIISSSNDGSSFGRSQTINLIGYYERFKQKAWWEIIVLLYLMIGLVVYTVGLCITADTFWAIFGPVSLFGFLFFASLHRDYREGSLSCSFLTEFRYKIFGD